MKYDNALLNLYTVEQILSEFGFRFSRNRGPCPLCATSKDSQSFSFSANVFRCFACGRGGNAVQLYAAITGIEMREAVEAVAQRLGLAEATPEARVQMAARAREAEAQKLRDDARSQGLTRLAAWAQEDERLARLHLEMSRGWGASAVAVEHVTEHYRLLRRVRHWDTLSDTAQSVSLSQTR